MNINNIKSPASTITIDRKKLEKNGKSVYEIINILSTRADQISLAIKKELDNKLREFVVPNDTLEEIFENREQIEISKVFEKLPKPTLIATQEFLDNKLKYYKK